MIVNDATTVGPRITLLINQAQAGRASQAVNSIPNTQLTATHTSGIMRAP